MTTESECTHLVDLDSVPNQTGYAVFRSSDGSIVRQPTGDITMSDLNVFYKIVLEIGDVLDGSSEYLKKVCVCGGSGDTDYSLSIGSDGFVYVVKKRIS